MAKSASLNVYATDVVSSHLLEIEKKEGANYWNFEGNSKRLGAHSLISYPAMMVPSLQGSLIDVFKNNSDINTILDPFVGSGTVMTESMTRTIDFTGIDINPLAILACKVKSGCYFVSSLQEKYCDLTSKIAHGRKSIKTRNFPGVEKWFHPQTTIELEVISRAIRQEQALWARRIFWLILARTVRQVSNSRLSTYKLHKREDADLDLYRNATREFSKQYALVFNSINTQYSEFNKKEIIVRGRYKGVVNTFVGDSNEVISTLPKSFDLIMTSPPYGDNSTTIPYGQYSYLPLHWIDLCDIDKNIDSDVIKNTHSIDASSLGGSLKNSASKIEYLCEHYPSAKKFIRQIKKSEQGIKRFSTFFADLDCSVAAMAPKTTGGGYHSWTVGNRRINDKLVPMSNILCEMLERRGLIPLACIGREIKNKKMASRNNIAATMSSESIVIAKKYL